MPSLIVLAGANGAGKSTLAPLLLRDTYGLVDYVNADAIAQGLAAFQPDKAAFEAGRIMLRRLHELASHRADFAFETTLSTLSYAPWIRELLGWGYEFHLAFLWLPTVELAVQRVRERVAAGGHAVPEEVIRRRYVRGIRNFLSLYLPLATTWAVYDNSGLPWPILIASGVAGGPPVLHRADLWYKFIR
jgi:predicted ABC-type ATPase